MGSRRLPDRGPEASARRHAASACRNTVRNMPAFSVLPGYRRSKLPARSKLDPFTSIIDQILEKESPAWHMGRRG